MSAHQNVSHDAATAAGTVANSNGSGNLRAASLVSAGETAQAAPSPGLLSRLGAAVCYAWSEVSRDKRWLVCMTAFALIWVAQLWLVQAKTLVSPQDAGPRFSAVAPFVRAAFDLLFVGVFCFSLGRAGLTVAALASFGINLFLVTYWHYFARPLSMLTVVHQWGEGAHVGSLGKAIWPAEALMWLSIALGAQLVLLALAGGRKFPQRLGIKLSALCAGAYLLLFTVSCYVDPLNTILTTRGIGRLGMIRGYTGPWLAELYYLGDKEILKKAIENRKKTSDKLTPLEAPLAVQDRLVIIQAESLCANVIGYQCQVRDANGKTHEVPVTPFLNQLRDVSRYYRIQAMHDNGSADADFVALNGVPPSVDVLNYNIPNYPYENTLPQFLSRYGFATTGLHGNTGNFYRRRDAWERMGFSRIIFQEELESKFDMRAPHWGVSDKDLFRASTQVMRTDRENKKFCHFLVTMTSHSPFNLIDLPEQELYPGASDPGERYMNSMRYLDSALRDYIQTLPKGTTVVIYGDHAAGLQWQDFVSDRVGGKDYVPCFIYNVGEDLAANQPTRDDPASKDGRLSLLDVMTYVRGQIDRASPLAGAPSPDPAGSGPTR